jgi:integrase
MDVAPDHMRPIIATVQFTGIRSKEIKFIRPEQVLFDQNRIELRAGETKNGNARSDPMNDYVKEVLLQWQEQTAAEYGKTETFFHFKGKKIRSWNTAWLATLKRAGLRASARGRSDPGLLAKNDPGSR